MGRRRERMAVDGRLFVVLVIATAVSAAVVARLMGLGVGRGVEVVIGLVLLAGLALASGVLDLRGGRLRRVRKAPWDTGLAALTAKTLGVLDRLEHRRLELVGTAPGLVVGPTGVVVVGTCSLRGPLHLAADGPRSLVDGRADLAGWEELRRLVVEVRRLVRGVDPGVPVRGIAVVAEGTQVTGGVDPRHGVSVVTVDRLVAAVSQGDLLPMTTLGSVFERLSTELASARPVRA